MTFWASCPKEDNDTSEDSTVTLILETIGSIIDEYNNTIAALVESSDEDSGSDD